MPELNQILDEFKEWGPRIHSDTINILGGEPTLNPNLCLIIEAARKHFPHSKGLLVSNGFFLSRHPELPKILIDNNFALDISRHGNSGEYNREFETRVTPILEEWNKSYPRLHITIRSSHEHWMWQYRNENGKPAPFTSNPRASWLVCMQRHCTQLYRNKLWKCPALAYFHQLEKIHSLEEDESWQNFRNYGGLGSELSDADIQWSLNQQEITQCSSCPAARNRFQPPDPTDRESNLVQLGYVRRT